MGRTIFPSVELSWGSGSRLKVFCLTRLLLPSSLVKRDQAVVGAFLFLESVPVVVSRFLTSSVLRLACVKQEENRGKRPPRRSLAPEAAGGRPHLPASSGTRPQPPSLAELPLGVFRVFAHVAFSSGPCVHSSTRQRWPRACGRRHGGHGPCEGPLVGGQRLTTGKQCPGVDTSRGRS